MALPSTEKAGPAHYQSAMLPGRLSRAAESCANRNCLRRKIHICGILAIRTYSPHSLMAVWNISWAFSGVLIRGSAPESARNFLVSGALTIWENHPLILSTIGLGVADGTMTPHQSDRSIGMPDSVMVGMSGCDNSRLPVETARMRMRPSRACA